MLGISTAPLNIRAARPDEAEAIRTLLIAAAASCKDDFDASGWASFLEPNTVEAIRARIEGDNCLTLVCEVENALAGLITMKLFDKVDQLFVHPSFRRRGIARRLWLQARAYCDLHGGTDRYWVRSSSMGVAMYENFGFRRVDERRAFNGISHYPMVLEGIRPAPSPPQLYDTIGPGYGNHRRPDPRIGAALRLALGAARRVINVGAGTGSYEPRDMEVVAVEPSRAMIRQRAAGSAPVVQASALHLPFADNAFEAALAILTVHHWAKPAQGLKELMRVSTERVVIFTFDPAATPDFWLVRDYFPELADIDRDSMPSLDALLDILGDAEVRTVPIPHDCLDGFQGAYWRRPRAYLDAGVRRAISSFAKIGDAAPGLRKLERDLDNGDWEQRNAHLLALPQADLGYRLIIGKPRGSRPA